mgnify:CR=1 FL=1
MLRSTSLDELPELFNILKGDMSIVGPRPLLVRYLPLYNEHQKHRHDVRPGLQAGHNAMEEMPSAGKKSLIWMSIMSITLHSYWMSESSLKQ